LNTSVGTTKTHSRQVFTLGQTEVPWNPRHFSRTVVSSVAGAGNYSFKAQKIEGVRTFAGQTVTLSFWAKADATKNITVEFTQVFGFVGSPSAEVTEIGVQKIQLTSTWQKYEITISIPSISGKVLGSDNKDSLNLLFWFDAGSTYASRTDTLGQQSGTFDIAQVQLEEGSVATPFEQRDIGTEWNLCLRYYETNIYTLMGSGASAGYFVGGFFPFIVSKRANPGLTFSTATEAINIGTMVHSPITTFGFRTYGPAVAAGNAYLTAFYYADAEL
jgi:hypothetical protein